MKQRILNWLIALDQFLFCCVTLGSSCPDETLSAAAWRWESAGKRRGRILRPLIDALFWFDANHCMESYWSEKTGKQLHKDYRWR